jgi:hypothetical protein
LYPTWSDEWNIDLTTDGLIHHEKEAGGESRTVMSWDNRVLVLTSNFCLGITEGRYESRFSMLPEGQCFMVMERLRGLRGDLDSAWWFRRRLPKGGC